MEAWLDPLFVEAVERRVVEAGEVDILRLCVHGDSLRLLRSLRRVARLLPPVSGRVSFVHAD
jgi:hypothetical protein